MHPAARYLQRLHQIHASGQGTAETSSYGPLEELLEEVGRGLKPAVVPIAQLRNTGAGMPDFGLFTKDQLKKGVDKVLALAVNPARGVVEVKGASDNTWQTAQGAQATKYWDKYRLVLVTNYRDFLILGQDADGKPLQLGTYSIAKDEAEFWAQARRAEQTAELLGDSFLDFLRRALLQNAPLREPEDLAALLAGYAREARERVERHAQLPALEGLRKAMEDSLGLSFEGADGERFFRSTLVQTLFYGVFSAWVAWAETAAPGETFNWKSADETLAVPVVQDLFEHLAGASRLDALGLRDVMAWAEDALNRVDRAAFFRRFAAEHAIQYFYEPFLQAFDPQLRKELGVWYTPREVVRYMVARVDRVLRDELGRPDGLADPTVHVLDPCCGTGAFLVEVARKIHANLQDAGKGALAGPLLKEALQERVFGFELLPAPFVVAHLQMGLMLARLGAHLGKDERLPVYLTNALTGWEHPAEPKKQAVLQQLADERVKADAVKHQKPILVILGNPPYSGYAGIAKMDEERGLADAYRKPAPGTAPVRSPEGQGLNDLYVRFFRMAERKIAEWSPEGVVSFISNYSWLDGLSHPLMRQTLLHQFDRIWIDSLNGDKFRTGKLTPEGEPDPSIFSTPQNREGIQVGTAIATFVRKTAHAPAETVAYRDLWGKDKLAQLDAEAAEADPAYPETIAPHPALGLPFRPLAVSRAYLEWPTLEELFPVSYPGVKTSRDGFLVDIDKARLEARLAKYFDPALSHGDLKAQHPEVMTKSARYEPEAIRDTLRKRGMKPEGLVRYAYRPLDVRWLYWEGETKLLDEKRPEYQPQVFEGNRFLVLPQRNRRYWSPPLFASLLADKNSLDGAASAVPMLLRAHHETGTLYAADEVPNLSEVAWAKLAELEQEGANQRCTPMHADERRPIAVHHGAARVQPALSLDPTDLFFHALAVLHAPAYRAENGGALRMDWPRIPWPASKEALAASAALGRAVAALLDGEQPVPGVTTGKIRAELKGVAVLATMEGAALDLEVTAGWGIRGQGGIAMPSEGRREGERVFLNGRTFWDGVPDAVWTYSLGGYPVLKKWLSYREATLLGRPLRTEEADHFAAMARRIAALLALGGELDANYRRQTTSKRR
ncbi:MAG: N-6 DNA Methylase [Acidobacteria bacterium ADurb.Bin340]|nr:MAG: N-6 DNA Methylase [Acidobacteria bacterium ADurb.Bin340]